MTTGEKTPQKAYYINSAIVMIIMFGFGYLPTINGITDLGMKVLGIFLGVLYGWIFVGFIWPSLIGMLALGLSGYDSILNVFAAGFGDSLVLKIFFLFIFARFLDQCGLTAFIAHWFTSRKVCQGRPWVLTTFIFVAASLICGFINVYGGIVIMWYILYSLLKEVGYQKGDGYTSYMVAGIVFIGTESILMLPFLPMAIIFRGLLKPELLADYTLSYPALTIFSMTLMIALTAGYIILGKYILRIDVSKLKQIKPAEQKKMNREQVTGMLSLLAFIIVLVLPMFLPQGALKALLSNIDVLGMAVILVSIACFRRPEGNTLYNFTDLVGRGINWDLIVLFAATMPLSAAMESDKTGIIATVINALMPVFSQLGTASFLVICLLIFVVTTQFAHNLILIIVFMPVLAALGAGMGIDPYMFGVVFTFAMQLAFLTPGASANAAMIFGNTEWISTKDTYKYGGIFVVMGFALIIVLSMTLGKLLF